MAPRSEARLRPAEKLAEQILGHHSTGTVSVPVEALKRLAYEYRQARFRIEELEVELDHRAASDEEG